MQTVLWHGGRRWEGGPEVQPPSGGRYECGPGIYLTNRYLRAHKYAKGGGVTTRVTLADDIRWLEHATLPATALLAYLRNTPRLRARKALVADMLQLIAEHADATQVPVSYLVNLLVNRDALAGKQGVALANWLAEQGIDASLHMVNAEEQWVIVFNPKVIVRHAPVPAGRVTTSEYDLPLIRVQKKESNMRKFEEAVNALQQARNQFAAGELLAVPYADAREDALARSLVALAEEHGVTLQQPLHIDVNGEYSIVAVPGNGSDQRLGCGRYGAEFAAILNQHGSPRCGVASGATLQPESGWCRMNHFDVERMVRAYAGVH